MWPAGTPAEHGLFVDHNGNVWVTGNGHVALKFSHDGQFLLQIGELGRTNGSNDPRLLGSSTDLAVDAATNELYIADGYINRRVIVFDADTGAYRRHWGAFGRRPNNLQLLEDRNGLIADPAEFYFPAWPAAAAVAERALCPRLERRDGVRVRPQSEPDSRAPNRRHVLEGTVRVTGYAGRPRIPA